MNTTRLSVSLVVGTAFVAVAGLLCTQTIGPGKAATREEAFLLPDCQLRDGDIVLRHGKGLVSELFAGFSLGDKSYSHAGVLSVENGVAYVYHTMGGRDNESGSLRRDRLTYFCRPAACSAMAVYRYDITAAQRTAMVALARQHYRDGLLFDETFDLESDDRMYCSEFVYKVTLEAVNVDNYLPLTSYREARFVAIDNLYLNPHAAHIYSHTFSSK